MKKFLIPLVLLVPLAAYAALKTWATGETIKASDLNSNFATVNTAANATITDARISSSAAISHSKLATPALVPKAWAVVKTTCGGGVGALCTVDASSRITNIVHSGTGVYDVAMAYTAANSAYAVIVSSGLDNTPCYWISPSTGSFRIQCWNGGVATDSRFSFIVMDDN